MRSRTIQWYEGQILKNLAKEKSIVLTEVRSIEEEHNFDIALVNLVSRRGVTRTKDEEGHESYNLAA